MWTGSQSCARSRRGVLYARFIYAFFLLLGLSACEVPIISGQQIGLRAPEKIELIEVDQDRIGFEWSPVWTAKDYQAYEVYLDGQLVAELSETHYLLTQLEAHTEYVVEVRAVDPEYNVSDDAARLVATTHVFNPAKIYQAPVDLIRPTMPQNLRATNISKNAVTLYWTPSTDASDIAEYQLFLSGRLYQSVADTRVQLTGLQPETGYPFQVRAVDTAGNASYLSEILSVTTGPALGALVQHGPEIYTASCAVCHGADGLGVGTTVGVTRNLTLAELTTIVEQTMPPADPTSCVTDCATTVAQYILDNFTAAAPVVSDPFAGFPDAATLLSGICGRAAVENRADAITDVFCGTAPARINSLLSLRSALGLAFANPTATGRRNNGANGNPSFAITGHSSSLVARQVNAINPRAIVFTANRAARGRGTAPAGFVATGFVRGDQFVEVIAADRNNNNALNFYLVKFDIPCNATASCTQADLLTANIETGWTNVTLLDEVNLANTIVDCLQCHQPAGPAANKILLMQELAVPWSHWFRSNTASSTLIDDFRAAQGTTQAYAGIPANLISASDPRLLEFLVRRSGSQQQNLFNSRRIQAEVAASAPGQPVSNAIPGQSATWNAINARTIAGQAIAVPYHDIKVTDPAVLPGLIQSLQDLRGGVLAPSALPDLRDAFYTAQLSDIGFRVAQGLDGEGIIRQACSQCHNSVLDQTISRARFNVDLNAMSDTRGGVLTGVQRDLEIGTAINRLRLSHDDVRVMPPELFRSLNAAEIDLAVEYFCGQTASVISQCAGTVTPADIVNIAM